ncbi:SGNH/GDSL hydrolase family protein [Algoriphagus sp. Y33]|uniref:SGNH/GDSL hydrolase family protein n=1 Tax=Algoriphagus sp. Y33 TaxID=2772483 RepID=UPI001783D1FB|nr:SGNH/GDSL hydrolase family protein [Algoriphagus sp. Y33]
MNIKISILFSFYILFIGNPKQKIFLIGDSISVHYTPYLKKNLDNEFEFGRKEDNGLAEENLDVPQGANGGNSSMVLEYLKSKLKNEKFRPDYLLLNAGLHDIKRNPVSNQIAIKQEKYKSNLVEIFDLLEENEIKPIWIKTTPVVDSIHNKIGMAFFRFSEDVDVYNRIADSLCISRNIPIIDLFGFSKKLGYGEYVDHVHFSEEARELQAGFIAGFLNGYMQ